MRKGERNVKWLTSGIRTKRHGSEKKMHPIIGKEAFWKRYFAVKMVLRTGSKFIARLRVIFVMAN